MRWSMIRLIWFRELRDQLRDRRTVFMIAVLPLILYPVLGAAVLQLFAAGLALALAGCGSDDGSGGGGAGTTTNGTTTEDDGYSRY